jgi:hypothetical protein
VATVQTNSQIWQPRNPATLNVAEGEVVVCGPRHRGLGGGERGAVREALRRWVKPALIVLGGLALLGVGAAMGVSAAEEQDGFCATCHLNPERTYAERARTVKQAYDVAQEQGLTGDALWQTGRETARDLASAHRAAALNCVACHRGDNGPGDRLTALTLGARNTLLYLSGQFDPDHSGVAKQGLVEGSCLHCHLDEPVLGGVNAGEENPILADSFENHFHSYLFAPEYVEQVTIDCLDCHASHREIPPIIPFFIDEQGVVLPACVQCHIEVQKGPVDL